jgi:hypothetical protein
VYLHVSILHLELMGWLLRPKDSQPKLETLLISNTFLFPEGGLTCPQPRPAGPGCRPPGGGALARGTSNASGCLIRFSFQHGIGVFDETLFAH